MKKKSVPEIPYTYRSTEYVDMVFVYGFCNGCANAAVQEYKVRYTNKWSYWSYILQFFNIFVTKYLSLK